MFSGAAAETQRSFPPSERHLAGHLHSYALFTPRTSDLPRPLEPRPTHHLRHVSATPTLRDRPPPPPPPPPPSLPAAESLVTPAQSGYRPQSTQNLPRIHDILTSAPSPAPNPTAYASSWNQPPPPPPPPTAPAPVSTPAAQPNGEAFHVHRSPWHPPLAHPPHESGNPYQPPPGRRLDLPILETSPVARHDSHSLPLSPYRGPGDSGSEYADPQRQHSTGSYFTTSAISPYATTAPDDMQYRSPASTLEQAGSLGSVADSSKKYLGIHDVLGEGTFHIYEGGFRIPTHVDGEHVNPAWGLTKANKPRKRLAMACLDCREKKIKCEPGPTSCLQCEKARRPCRKAPAHQGTNEPNTAGTWPGHSSTSPPRNHFADPATAAARETEYDMSAKRRTSEIPSPTDVPAKRHRSASPPVVVTVPHSMAVQPPSLPQRNGSPAAPTSPVKTISLEEDPYAVEPEATRHLLRLFFAHINDAAYTIFPRRHFMHWVTTSCDKSPTERMLLYAALALGSVFADSQQSHLGDHFVALAADAVKSRPGHFDLACIQTRLLVGLFYEARGESGMAWDFISCGINAATYLRLQTEQGCVVMERPPNKSRNEFALSDEQLIECKRRTAWTGFLLDRFCGASRCLINPMDMFIRLPCSDDAFDHGLQSDAPFFENGVTDSARTVLTANSPVSPMAWLLTVAETYGEVNDFVHRATHRSANTYEAEYETFYASVRTRLRNWLDRLPEPLQITPSNIERSIFGSYAAPFISMHALHHLCWLRMSRFAKHEQIPRSIARNVQAAHRHAEELLTMISMFRSARWDLADRERDQGPLPLVLPMVGRAILGAVDIVGAGGLDSHVKSTLELINCGLDCLRELGGHWNSAKDQAKACQTRYYQIQNVLKHPFTARSGCWLGREWGVTSPLENEFSLENDCIYGVSDRDYFDALKDDATDARKRS